MYINNQGHMTKMVAIYGKKNLQKSSPKPILRQGQHRSPMHLNGKTFKKSFEAKILQEMGSRYGGHLGHVT